MKHLLPVLLASVMAVPVISAETFTDGGLTYSGGDVNIPDAEQGTVEAYTPSSSGTANPFAALQFNQSPGCRGDAQHGGSLLLCSTCYRRT